MSQIKQHRPPKRLWPRDMRELALAHLDRFATTKRRLRELLKRRALLSAATHGDEAAPLLDAIECVIHWLESKGLLSDRAYAEGKSRTLAGRGQSRRRIAANLMAKGIDLDTAKAAIKNLADEFGDTDLAAAKAYAKRRRLGRYRGMATAAKNAAGRDLAAMARAGFSLDVARKALAEEEE